MFVLRGQDIFRFQLIEGIIYNYYFAIGNTKNPAIQIEAGLQSKRNLFKKVYKKR